MDPITLGALAVAYLTGAATKMGEDSGSALFKKVGDLVHNAIGTGACSRREELDRFLTEHKSASEKAVAERVASDASFKSELMAALPQKMIQNPGQFVTIGLGQNTIGQINVSGNFIINPPDKDSGKPT